MIYYKTLYGAALLVMVLEMILVSPKILGRREMLIAGYPNKLADQGHLVADQAIKGMHLIETKAGQRLWELNSDAASEFKGKGQLVLDKIKTRFFGNEGIQFAVKGARGNMDLDENNMAIDGDVVTKTSNNYELRSNIVNYTARGRELSSPEAVSILGPKDRKGNRLRLEGVGMRAQVADGQVEILSGVHGEVTLDNGELLKIKSQSVELSSVSKQAIFHGNVEIDVETLRVTGPNAKFQYASDEDTLASVEIEGGVKVSDVDKFATSQNVSVDFKEEKLVFKGHPRLVRENDEVFGDEIVFLNGGKRIQVKGAKAQLEPKSAETKK